MAHMRHSLNSSCPRCGGEHPDLEVIAFTRPVAHQGMAFGYWAWCPVTLDPILIQIESGQVTGAASDTRATAVTQINA